MYATIAGINGHRQDHRCQFADGIGLLEIENVAKPLFGL
jgi:hypothetical protein